MLAKGAGKVAAVTLILGTVAVACSGADNRPDAAPKPVTFQDVSFGAALGQIRGHHLVGIELYRGGDTAGALAHAGHPIAEILKTVEGAIREKDAGAAAALEDALDDVFAAAQARKPAEDFSNAIDVAAASVRRAEAVVVGRLRTSEVYRGSVVAAILAAAAQEYGEALRAGKVAALVEYQDAYGFIRVANERYAEIRTAVTRKGAVEARQIDGAFERLDRALPSPAPPAVLARFEDVRADAVLVGAKIQETVGAVLAPPREPREIVARIKQLLDESLAEYQRGEPRAAADLAAEAYLQNYELIEVDVIRLAAKVNAELEPILGSLLRERMGRGAPAAEIRRMIERAKVLLDQALQALETG